MKTCPFCAEEIQDAAIKCKHCGEFLGQKHAEPNKEQHVVAALTAEPEVVPSDSPTEEPKIVVLSEGPKVVPPVPLSGDPGLPLGGGGDPRIVPLEERVFDARPVSPWMQFLARYPGLSIGLFCVACLCLVLGMAFKRHLDNVREDKRSAALDAQRTEVKKTMDEETARYEKEKEQKSIEGTLSRFQQIDLDVSKNTHRLESSGYLYRNLRLNVTHLDVFGEELKEAKAALETLQGSSFKYNEARRVAVVHELSVALADYFDSLAVWKFKREADQYSLTSDDLYSDGEHWQFFRDQEGYSVSNDLIEVMKRCGPLPKAKPADRKRISEWSCVAHISAIMVWLWEDAQKHETAAEKGEPLAEASPSPTLEASARAEAKAATAKGTKEPQAAK